jgi:predicted ribosomally synthesized peptide with nif11-like leader
MIFQFKSLTEMTISQSKVLYKKLKVDVKFREALLSAETMAECVEIVAAHGLDCTKDEIKTVIGVFSDGYGKIYNGFTLWGNRIYG